MRIGVSFPTVEIGADLAVVRDFVHTAEELGYTHFRLWREWPEVLPRQAFHVA